ncbi:MAG: isocitrate lyase/phosphoenolpyruvate mutase family protein [Candidatus Binatia bacterium]
MKSPRKSKALAFHALHRSDRILVLPNAWDAASARIFELAGARAVATSSAGLANAQGFPDGEKIPLDLLLLVVRRISEREGRRHAQALPQESRKASSWTLRRTSGPWPRPTG